MSHRISVLLVSVCAALLPAFPSGNSHLVTTRNSRSRNSRVFSHSNSVLPGIDILLRDSIGVVQGKRLGLITHQSGIDAAGVSTIDRLSHDPRVRLVSLFAPEHGMRSLAAPGELVTDTVDAATGLPIYSLYGASRAPTPARLEALDVLVVDLQDVGSRTWTYVSTMVLALRAGAVAHRRVVVLDRPNPIGCEVQGPILDTAYASFIGMLPIPLRHGMTMGELARFANARLGIGADLVVVPADGWRRCDWFDRTGLPWVRPSPNLPDLENGGVVSRHGALRGNGSLGRPRDRRSFSAGGGAVARREGRGPRDVEPLPDRDGHGPLHAALPRRREVRRRRAEGRPVPRLRPRAR